MRGDLIICDNCGATFDSDGIMGDCYVMEVRNLRYGDTWHLCGWKCTLEFAGKIMKEKETATAAISSKDSKIGKS
jgi:hypothetical protein